MTRKLGTKSVKASRTVTAEFPERVLGEMEALVRAGWFHDLNDLMIEAVRRLLDTHRPEVMERFIREDVDWALHSSIFNN